MVEVVVPRKLVGDRAGVGVGVAVGGVVGVSEGTGVAVGACGGATSGEAVGMGMAVGTGVGLAADCPMGIPNITDADLSERISRIPSKPSWLSTPNQATDAPDVDTACKETMELAPYAPSSSGAGRIITVPTEE